MNAATTPATTELVPPPRFDSVEEAQRYLKSQGVQYVLRATRSGKLILTK